MVLSAMQGCVNYTQGANDPLVRATKDQRNGSEYGNSKRNVYYLTKRVGYKKKQGVSILFKVKKGDEVKRSYIGCSYVLEDF